ncbi:bifunctional acetaldehyde-CoA/alcohol dehydrogenase [Gemella sp. GH3]|uniref:bifunctional acetaldehyde-CoA/alcohol dehydrogenase n=1 Tax=unclassified Gemella TaxID=2624949 RepID=UPI0015CF9C38|nr:MULTISPECIES: bifunctional acetaldehyde-CoA/alcohol dehydrogenase [unclassified Gemella]MBF0713677.1 bifunctional acetaldehyde-CoA/alcohol dehydrogenase [Gemella sp. GH3.1]NYS50629.1 bifunctional acetaldehyde-CoA/alcohol dehydrogenase [Gemella sp. GH3]
MAKAKEVTINPVEEVNVLVEKAQEALSKFLEIKEQEKIDEIVQAAAVAALAAHGPLAVAAVEETGRGVVEDKATKNLYACEYIVNSMRGLKTVGVVDRDEVDGLVAIAEPVGVICGVVPTTNPTSTTIFKSLISLKTRNPIIFSFHPSANECSKEAARIVRDAAVAAGAPENCIQFIEKPSMEGTNALMNHDGVATILATGGNAMVRAAYSCGKPALGVGAGNVPAYIHKEAKLKQAVNDIVLSKAFDNGMICASEQAAIVDKELYDEFVSTMKSHRVYFVNKKEKALLEKLLFGVEAKSKDCAGAKLNSVIVGKPATEIAKLAGFEVPEGTVILAAECSEVGVNEPLTREKLSPVLAVIKSKDTKDGLEKSRQMVEFNGLGHTAAIHTQNAEVAEEFGEIVRACRIVWNSPSTFGGIGDVYNAFIPSLTLGCGSYGRNSVSGNVSAVNLLNIKLIGRRNNNMQWFKVPPKIYFEPNAIRYLRDMEGLERVVIVTDESMVKLGFVQKVVDQLNKRSNKVQVQVFDGVEPNPDITTVKKGTELMESFKPDAIVALGGGSPIDAAKIMWLFYERPDADFNELVQKFADIRKRTVKYPSLGKVKFIAIPTTSGTGSEVTPFAVISDKENDKKYPLADYAITPHVAIVDPNLVLTVPKRATAATGMDVLTHATEAYVAILANDYTDGIALKAIKLVFENLEKSVHEADRDAREKMHNASCLAGMAFANAFLGIAHSMSHKIGGKFHTVHGENNATLLPYVIKYNGTKPGKVALWPKYEHYQAAERYQEIAKMLGLKADTPEQGVESYAQAVYELGRKVGCPMAFKEHDAFAKSGIGFKEYKASLEKLAFDSFEDQCTPANPRLAMIKDMEGIMEAAWDGYGEKKFVEKI